MVVDKTPISVILADELVLTRAAAGILEESLHQDAPILAKSQPDVHLSAAGRETPEAVSSRFSRLSYVLFRRLFRRLDSAELVDGGTNLDRLNRMEKRGILSSVELWRDLREPRNQIAHAYLIKAPAEGIKTAFHHSTKLRRTVHRLCAYVKTPKL